MRFILLGLQLLLFSFLFLSASPSEAAGFTCSGPRKRCQSMLGYPTVNATTYSGIKTMFGIKSIYSLFGANNLPLATLPSTPIPANTTIRIPFPCICSNNSGISDRLPTYTVVPNDGLFHIANDVFGGFMKFEDIQAVNNIKNASITFLGQRLRIPLPCSCDQVDGMNVVHFAHKVVAGSTVDSIASQFGTTSDTLLKLNGIASPKDLLADEILDVPLKVCSSSIRNDSIDSPLLVPNDTYVLTAKDCVQCSCNAATYLLKCVPTQGLNQSCPATTCPGTNYPIGTTLPGSSPSACNATTCAYTGYNRTTIFSAITNTSTCPAGGGGGALSPSSPPPPGNSAFQRQGLGWMELLVFANMILFSFGLL